MALSAMDGYKLLLAFGALIALMLTFTAWHRRRVPGALSLIALLLSSTWWLVAYALPLTGMTQDEADFLRVRLIFPGVVVLPAATLVFALTYVRKSWRPTPLLLAALAVEPVIVITAVALPGLHDAFYGSWRGRAGDGVFHGGPIFSVHTIYTYALMGKALSLFAKYYRNGSLLQRRRTRYILIAMLIPVVCNVIFLLGLLRTNVDPTPLGLTVTGFLISLVLFRRGVRDLVTVAREKVHAVIPDGFVLVDAQCCVIEATLAVQTLLALPRPVNVGSRLKDEAPELERYLQSIQTETTTIEFISTSGAFLELRILVISDDQGELNGYVLILRDVSEAKASALALEQANEQLRAQLAKIEEMQVQLREQAIRDPLTGLYNRRFLDEILPKQIRQAAQNGASFAVVMIDIDHFKSVNDMYGHAAGDTLLRALGSLLLHYSRGADSVCRYGGEEFAVVMDSSNVQHAAHRVNEWRAAFAAQYHVVVGDEIARTFSAGVAQYPSDGADAPALLEAADRALYRAKLGGRNLVERACHSDVGSVALGNVDGPIR
jgi:diguanylate cyclase (GGDEF)-like protein